MKQAKPKRSRNEIAAKRVRGKAEPIAEGICESVRVVSRKKLGKGRTPTREQEAAPNVDPLKALAGTWTFGDADCYVRQQREGWG